jgi:short-subunit dehydrogenase
VLHDPPRRLAVVTGATSGIGRAMAGMLVTHAYDLVVVSRSRSALEDLRRDLGLQGGSVTPLSGDLTDDATLAAIAAAVREDGRSIDLVVHSAGLVELGPLADDGTLARFDRQIALNARAPLALTHTLLPLVTDGTGHLVFVNSTAGLRANAHWGTYAASKYALRAVADALRDELRPRGIRVTTLFPGRTDTPMQREVHAAEGRSYDAGRLLSAADVAEVLRTVIALPPGAEVSDVTIRPAQGS